MGGPTAKRPGGRTGPGPLRFPGGSGCRFGASSRTRWRAEHAHSCHVDVAGSDTTGSCCSAIRSFAPAAARAIYSGIGFIPAVLCLVVELAIRTVFVSSVLWAILVLLSDAITRLDVASHIDAAFRLCITGAIVMTGAIIMCTSNHVRPQQYRFLLVFLVFLLQIQGADAVGSASAAAQAATQGVAGLALGAVGARAATITTTGNSSAQNKNAKKKKKSKDSSLIADHGFGEGFATMRHAPSAPIQPLRQRSLIADHGFGEGFATITAAPSAPPIKPSSHQPTYFVHVSQLSFNTG